MKAIVIQLPPSIARRMNDCMHFDMVKITHTHTVLAENSRHCMLLGGYSVIDSCRENITLAFKPLMFCLLIT